MRLYDLFGDSVKAAETLHQIAQCCKGMNCSACPLVDICFRSREDYVKWLEASTGSTTQSGSCAAPVTGSSYSALTDALEPRALDAASSQGGRAVIDLGEYEAPAQDAKCYSMSKLCNRLVREGRMNGFAGAYAGMISQMLGDAGYIEKKGKSTRPLALGLRVGIRENTWLDERYGKELHYCSYPYALADLYLKLFSALSSGAAIELIGELSGGE